MKKSALIGRQGKVAQGDAAIKANLKELGYGE